MKNFHFGKIVFLFLIMLIQTVKAEGTTSEQIKALEGLSSEIEEQEEQVYKKEITSIRKDEPDCLECIYGYDLFASSPTTFSQLSDVPVPPDYMLGPGDKLSIQYIGNETKSKEVFIERTGVINLPLLGPITLAGLTFSEARKIISNKVKSELIGTEPFMTLSELRSIDIYLVGAAYRPGVYSVSSLSTITNALFASGGPSKVGSLRNIQLKRNGKLVKEFDLYSLLLKGDTSNDARLQQGDVIFIPLLKETVRASGDVQRPGRFEIKAGEKVSDLYEYAGFKNKNGRLEVNSIDLDNRGRRIETFLMNDKNILNNLLENSDAYYVTNSSDFQSKSITISGQVTYPGTYSINSDDTLLSVINRAGGLKDIAYTIGAVFTREDVAEMQKAGLQKSADILERILRDSILSNQSGELGPSYGLLKEMIGTLRTQEPSGRQVVELDTYKLKSDPKLNFNVHDGDSLYIPKRPNSIAVLGEVTNQITHLYDNNYGVYDYIKLSGGLGENADKSKIFVIQPNGQAVTINNKLFSRGSSNAVLPGSTIYVSQKIDTFNFLGLAAVISPILSDLALSSAALQTISNN